MYNARFSLFVCVLFLLPIQNAFAQSETDAKWQTINANDLKEWSDPGKWWSASDGVIVADSKGGRKLPKVHYLVWDGSIKGDFELSLQYRILAKTPQDAGVNFRVERPFKPAPNLPSYQAELDTCNLYSKKPFIKKGKLFGHIHDGKRTRMFQRNKRVTIKADGTETTKPLKKRFRAPKVFRKPPEWNHCRVRVVGDTIELYLNDELANVIVDGDEKNKSTGDGIALQFRPKNKNRFEVKELKYRLLGKE